MDVISIPYLYATTLWQSVRHRGLFDDVKTFVMFIGYPRSAHTLIGFLLDAHPNIIVASQKSALKYLKYGFMKQQIFHILLQNSRKVAKVGRGWRPYSYAVPNQWQGRFQKLKVIGDSTGFTRLRRNPALLKTLQATLQGVELKLIHCVRNPYDNISTMQFRSGQSLPDTIERYFSMCETVEQIKQQFGNLAVHDLKHEAVVGDPKAVLKQLGNFLGVNASESYYEDCASIIYKSPHKSRFENFWNQELINAVKDKMSRFSFLDGYAYND